MRLFEEGKELAIMYAVPVLVYMLREEQATVINYFYNFPVTKAIKI